MIANVSASVTMGTPVYLHPHANPLHSPARPTHLRETLPIGEAASWSNSPAVCAFDDNARKSVATAVAAKNNIPFST
jgi:hypothetical protein